MIVTSMTSLLVGGLESLLSLCWDVYLESLSVFVVVVSGAVVAMATVEVRRLKKPKITTTVSLLLFLSSFFCSHSFCCKSIIV